MPEKTYRVVMRNEHDQVTEEAVDPYVPADQVAAYVQDAETRWQHVEATLNDDVKGP